MARTFHHPLLQLISEDPRYSLEAYQFVREALAFAQEYLQMGQPADADPPASGRTGALPAETEVEHHLTGQELCEAARQYAVEQYGLLARVVLKNLGIQTTSDIGNIVYNLIRVKLMKKSPTDRREDFDNVFDFADAFNDPTTFSKTI
jgi:uncharacterized repeat protein (TIGR04138 family)